MVSPLLLLLVVAAELLAHRREEPVGEVGLAPRREAGVERGAEHAARARPRRRRRAMVQRPSPESDTRPSKSARSGDSLSACAVRSSSHDATTLPRRHTSATAGMSRSYSVELRVPERRRSRRRPRAASSRRRRGAGCSGPRRTRPVDHVGRLPVLEVVDPAVGDDALRARPRRRATGRCRVGGRRCRSSGRRRSPSTTATTSTGPGRTPASGPGRGTRPSRRLLMSSS